MARAPDSLIRCVVGKLGSGKTWYTVMRMVEALMQGRVVVTNIVLNWPAVEAYARSQKVGVNKINYRWVSSDEIDVSPDVVLSKLPTTGSCLVIDEVHLFLNARRWKENQAKCEVFLDFLTQARKLDVDIYLISQDERNVDAQLQRMVTHFIRVKNWRHLPVFGNLFPFPLTIAQILEPDMRTRVGRDLVWRSGKIGVLYNSKQTFKGIALTGEPAAPVIGKQSRGYGWGYRFMIFGGFCLGLDWGGQRMGFWGEKNVTKILDRPKESAAAKKPAPPNATPPAVSSSGFGTSASAATVVQPVQPYRLTRPDLARLMHTLPRVYRVTPFYVCLMGGAKLGPGSFFLDGSVVGWAIQQDSIVLHLDSPEIPKIRLFYGNRPEPVIYDHQGGLVGVPSGIPRGLPAIQSAPDNPVGEGVTGDPGPQGQPPAPVQYSAPPVYVPDMSHGTRPSALPTDKWASSQRRGSPAPATGFGFGNHPDGLR